MPTATPGQKSKLTNEDSYFRFLAMDESLLKMTGRDLEGGETAAVGVRGLHPAVACTLQPPI